MFLRQFPLFLNTDAESSMGGDSSPQDASSDEMAVAPDAQKLLLELDAAKLKINETHDRMLRIAADFENARKRWDRERDEVRTYCNSEFARSLLPVIDAFEKAMGAINETTFDLHSEDGKKMSAIIEGIKIVSSTFGDTMAKNGIERVASKGEPFDPKFHNAVSRTIDEAVKHDMVIDEFVPGYKLGERVLRTAMVRVATPD